MDALYTTHDVSRLLQVDPSTVSKWVDRGLLEAFKTPGGHRRIRASLLRAFASAHGMPMPPELGGQTHKVLLVDNSKGALEAFKKAIRGRAWASTLEVVHFESGVQALLELERVAPSVVLWDLGTPDADAYEVLRHLTAQRGAPAVYAVARKASGPNEAKALKAGAQRCVARTGMAEALEQFLASR